jgi:hypothetical protein
MLSPARNAVDFLKSNALSADNLENTKESFFDYKNEICLIYFFLIGITSKETVHFIFFIN